MAIQMAGITYEIDDKNLVEQIRNDAKNAAKELVEKAHLTAGKIVVVGCSTSSTLGILVFLVLYPIRVSVRTSGSVRCRIL